MTKKIIGCLLAVCLVVGMMPTMASVVRAEAQQTASSVTTQCETYEGTNINAQNYSRWSSPIASYLVPMSDGGVMRVQAGSKIEGLLVEYYDAAHNIQPSKTKHIAKELPIFGGFYATSDAYYVLTGQTNMDEDPSVEVYRITKYDTNWNRKGSDGLPNCNTTVPFDAGSARMEAYGDYLLIHTCHKMYKSSKDGLNHQANVTIQFNMQTMKITDSYTDVMNSSWGYVSHSFNQFIHIEDGHIITVDHGDAFPRSIALIKYPSDVTLGKFVTSGCSVIDVMEFSGPIGENSTGASVGAFEVSDSSYLIAGNADSLSIQGTTRNIFVASVDKSTNNVTTNWLTSYAQGEGTTSTPHMVKLSNDRYVVLWSEGENVYYIPVNGKGQAQAAVAYSMKGQLSDCVPVVANGKITWYTWKNGTITFYDIDVSELSKNTETVIENGHHYEIVKTENGVATLHCTVCNKEKLVGTCTSYSVWWNEEGGSGYYYSNYSGTYTVGDSLYLRLQGTEYPSSVEELNSEWTIEISDEKLMSYTITSASSNSSNLYLYFTMLSPGTVTVTVHPKYNPDNAKTYKIIIESDPIESIEVSPSSLTLLEGQTEQLTVTVKPDTADKNVTFSSSDTSVATVSAEGIVTAVKAGTATITATAADGSHKAMCKVTVSAHTHKMTHHEGTEPTCTEPGTKAYYECSECGRKFSDEAGKEEITDLVIPAKGHSFTKYVSDDNATCTKDGTKTAKCDNCDETDEKPDEGSMKPHQWSNWEITKNPTCTDTGTQSRTCENNCGTTEDKDIDPLGHSWVEIVDRPATEEQTGLKHEQCTVCHEEKEAVEIPKLDHTHDMTYHEGSAATCTQTGTKAYYECSKCGKKYSDAAGNLEITDLTIPATGHSFTHYEFIEGSASCTEDGKETAKCDNCDVIDTRTAEGTKESHEMTCHEGKPATCTEAGIKTYYECSKCGKKYNNEAGDLEITDLTIPAMGHSFTNYVFNEGSASCLEDGTETAKCDNNCGETDTRVAKGTKESHQMTHHSEVKAACTEPGIKAYYECGKCGKYYSDAEGKLEISEADLTIPAIGHSWVGEIEWAEDNSSAKVIFTCDNDKTHLEKLDCEVSSAITKPASGTEKGIITYTATVKRDDETEPRTYTKEVETSLVESKPVGDGSIATEVTVDPNVPTMSVDNLTTEMIEKSLTEDELEEVKSGKNLTAHLSVTNINDEVSDTEKGEAEQKASAIVDQLIESAEQPSGKEVKTGIEYIDISLFTQIGEKRTPLTDIAEEIQVTIVIPESLRALGSDYGYSIIRVHGNEITELPYEYDAQNHTLTFKTKQFSTYAIVYAELIIPVTDITLNMESKTIDEKGGTVQLTAEITPSDATDKNLNWTSSNTDVATVDANGKVTAVGEGTCTITVKTRDGSVSATCTITVKFKTNNGGGTIGSGDNNNSGTNNQPVGTGNNSANTQSPKTGDNSSLILWIIFLLLSIAVLSGIIGVKEEKHGLQ